MSTLSGGGKANELTFQNDMAAPGHPCTCGICASMHIIRQLVANGWLLGKPESYNRELALYEEDVLGFGHCVDRTIDYYHLVAIFARSSTMG